MQHVDATVRADQRKDVAASAGGSIRPQPRLVAIENYLEAVAGAAQYVADQELATALLACRKHSLQNRFQASDQICTNGFSLLVAVMLR